MNALVEYTFLLQELKQKITNMKNLIVHCPTKEECEAVQKKMFSEGRYWDNSSDEKIQDYWDYYEDQTCISSTDNNYFEIGYCDKSYYEENYLHIPIITVEEYLKETMTKKLYILVNNKEDYKKEFFSIINTFVYPEKEFEKISKSLKGNEILIETTIDKIFEKGGLKEIEI